MIPAESGFAAERAPTRPRQEISYTEKMRISVRLFSLFALLAAGYAFGQNDSNRKEWIPLFNGRNLDGWTPKITGYDLNDNFGNTFRVKNGYLTVSYDKYDKFNEDSGTFFISRNILTM